MTDDKIKELRLEGEAIGERTYYRIPKTDIEYDGRTYLHEPEGGTNDIKTNNELA